MKILYATAFAAVTMMTAGAALAQNPPATSTKKVEGTDNVYVFRYGGHQSMFVVTPAGVIATDPISYLRPAKPYIDAIKAVTDKPIKYVIYSHHHYDHIAGGKPFKDLGAIFIAHRRVKERFLELKKQNALLADVVMPDQLVDGKKTITLGGTTVELLYLGANHSDSNIVIRLPKEKIVFVVDTIPVGSFPGRGMIDFYPAETEAFIKKVIALDWDRLIPGHPGQPGGRLGTKQDAQNVLTLYQEASAELKKMGQDGKCWDTAEKEFKMPKYATLPGYEAGLGMVARRYCGYWGRGT